MMPEDLQNKSEAFEADLKRYFYVELEPAILREAMAYSLYAPSKRVRPILLLETVYLFDGDRQEALPLAVGMELIHTYSLIHDDLPCMDDDDLRRGQASSHVKYGEAMALLAGDALLNTAYEIMLAGAMHTTHKARYLSAFEHIAKAAGARGMVAGQVMDLLSQDGDPNGDLLRFIHTHKTGALLSSAVAAGAVIAGAGKNELRNLMQVGDDLGLMFQIVDDLLDEYEPEVTGKTSGSDNRHNKLTYNRVYGIPAARKMVRQLRDGIHNRLIKFGSTADFFRELTDFLSTRTY